MNVKIAIVVEATPNPWFRVMADNGIGGQNEVSSGSDLGRALNYAAVMLGHPLVIPISGPETVL